MFNTAQQLPLSLGGLHIKTKKCLLIKLSLPHSIRQFPTVLKKPKIFKIIYTKVCISRGKVEYFFSLFWVEVRTSIHSHKSSSKAS